MMMMMMMMMIMMMMMNISIWEATESYEERLQQMRLPLYGYVETS